MAATPQLTGSRIWSVIGRRREGQGLPSGVQVQRRTVAEAELLARLGEISRTSRTSSTSARALIARQRWF
jgi:hypothetical protein